MRVDLNPVSMPELERSRGSSTAAGSSGAVESTSRNEDVASLSTGHEAVSTLGSQLQSVPDVRQGLVESLRQAIHCGSYRISPDGIADKMIAEGLR